MPNIKQYDTPALDIRPTEVGIHATEAVGRRAGQFFNQMGQALGGGVRDLGDAYVAYQDHQQISTLAKSGTDLTLDKEKKWDDIVKSPAFDPSDPAYDPTVAAKFREEELEPAIEKFKASATTQKSQQFAEQFAEHFRSHMVNKTMADSSRVAGDAVKTERIQTVNNLASAVYRDPSSLEFALKTLDMTMKATVSTSQNLSAADTSKLLNEHAQKEKHDVIHSAVAGMLEKNPNVNLDDIQKKYGEYITGPEMRQFQKAAQAYQKSELLKQKQTEIAQRQLNGIKAHEEANAVMSETVKIDPITGRPVIDPSYFNRSLNIAKRDAGIARTMIDWGETQQNKEARVVTDPAVRADLFSRIGAPDNPTTEIEILRAEANPNGKLSHADGLQLRALQKAVQDRPEGEPIRRSRDDFFKRFAGVIHSSMDSEGAPSMLGSQRLYEAQMDARHAEDVLRSQGKDPALVYDPRSPEFFGDPRNMARYHVSMQQDTKYRRDFEAGKIGSNKPVALPTIEKREDGKVYDTAKGKMRWDAKQKLWFEVK